MVISSPTRMRRLVRTNKISQYYGVASEGASFKILNNEVPNLPIKDIFPDSTTVRKLRERGA